MAAIGPAWGAIVMGTGIVSVALTSDHQQLLSRLLLAIAAFGWLALGLVLATRVLRDPSRARTEARSPAALTGVAATAVVGARVVGLGWNGVALALLLIAACLWLVLLGPVLASWKRAAPGVAFMVAVSTQALAVLAAQLAVREPAPWLLYAAVVLFLAGLVLYWVALVSFDFRQLLDGHGDQWVSGGALAISTLAMARITISARALHRLGISSGSLHALTLVLWALSAAWLPALLLTEVIRPRLRYDVRRWATVFPFGMYAACSFDAGIAAHVRGLIDFARIWLWVSFALWAAVLAGLVWQLVLSRRGGDGRVSCPTAGA